MKIDKKGKITIPKKLREKYGISGEVELVMHDCMEYDGPKIILRAKSFCSVCKKALPDDLAERGACLDCTPVPKEIVRIY